MIGFTNGCFDLLHEGHIHFLQHCRGMCDELIVALNTDLSVRGLKGEGRPVDPWAVRERKLKDTGLVSKVFPFAIDQQIRTLIRATDAEVLFKGDEYVGRDLAGQDLVKAIVLIPMLPGFSTTAKIRRLH